MKFVSFYEYINTQNADKFNIKFIQFNGRNNWFYNKRINLCRPFLSEKEERITWENFTTAQSDDAKNVYRNLIVERYLWLAIRLLHYLQYGTDNSKFMTEDEAYSYLQITLINCVNGFDPKQDVNFYTYYTAAVKNNRPRYCADSIGALSSRTIYMAFEVFKCAQINNGEDPIYKYNTAIDLKRILNINCSDSISCSKFIDMIKSYIFTTSLNVPSLLDEEIEIVNLLEDKNYYNHEIDVNFSHKIKVLKKKLTDIHYWVVREYDDYDEKAYNRLYKRHSDGVDAIITRCGYIYDECNDNYCKIADIITFEEFANMKGKTRQRIHQMYQIELDFINKYLDDNYLRDLLL